MSKNILVTGGAGFVGSHLSKVFLNAGYAVTIIDDLSNGKLENLPPEAEFVEMDLAEAKAYDLIPIHSYQAVIHCAAQASNAISWAEPQRDLLVNQVATYNLLEYCVTKNIKRVLFTSSMSAYGEPAALPTPESIPMLPETFYAVHKLASEHYLRIYAKEHGLQTTIFRLYTTYGHGQNLDNINQGLLSIYLAFIVQNKTMIVKGSKDRTRDIVHVSDVVNAIILALDNPNSYDKTYNLGSGETLKISEIVELLSTGMGHAPGEYPVTYEDGTQGDPFHTLASIKSIKDDIGWEPQISPRAGIKLTIEAYLQEGK
jgi:UDP-glucose 4-epimerase